MATEETLAWEARHRPRAALAAIFAALIPILTTIAAGPALSDGPTGSMLDTLGRAAQPGPLGTQPTAKAEVAQFTADRAATLMALGIGQAIASLLTGYVLWVLARAARARAPEVGRVVVRLPLIGTGLLALVLVLGRVGQLQEANAILDGPRTVDAAADASGSINQFLAYLSIPAILVFSAGIGYAGLVAMRVGLLTRFMGVLAIVIGVAFAFTYGAITPLPLALWLGLMVMMFAGRWPGGQPPAWLTGRAEPWPSQQELREQRLAGAGKSRSGPEPEPEPEPAAAAAGGAATPSGRQHPSSRKKKRKRRT